MIKNHSGILFSFRNLKRATDEALALLFSNKERAELCFCPSFDEIKQDYEQAVKKLLVFYA